MKKTTRASLVISLLLGSAPLHAASLDDVMAELKNLRRENAAIRHELATLRQDRTTGAHQIATPQTPVRPVAQTTHTEAAISSTFDRGLSPRSAPAPLYANEIYDWGGFYAGLNGGYASGKSVSTFNVTSVFTADTANSGAFGGAQLGYNFQYDRTVLGIEADYQYAALGGSMASLVSQPTYGQFVNSKVDGFGTLRARLGYAWGRLLPFVTGGVAVARNEASTDAVMVVGATPFLYRFNDAQTHVGWTVGGGLEYGVSADWSAKVEYLHLDLGSRDYFEAGYGAGTFTIHPTLDLVRGGVNYRF